MHERKVIAAAVASALAVPMSADAVEFAVSGHVNRAVIVVDQDGSAKDGDLQHVDANASQSRFRLKGSGELDSGLTAGVNIELGVLSTGSTSGTTTRHAAANLSGDFGTLTLGHTSEAADGMAHAEGAFNGGSWLGGVTNWCSFASSGPACPSNDGTRTDVLKYDTPALGPAKVSVSTGDDERWSSQLKVAGSAGDAGYDFRIGYIAEFDTDVAAKPASVDHDAAGNHMIVPATPATTKKAGDVLTTSAAVNFGQGTTLAAAWSRDDMPSEATKEHEYTYLSVDQSYGDGSVGVYWKQGETSDSAGTNVEGTLWGIGIGHSIGGGATAYAGFRRIEEDSKDDINLYLAGMRVTFN